MWKRQFSKIPLFFTYLQKIYPVLDEKSGPLSEKNDTIHLVYCLLQIVEVSCNLQMQEFPLTARPFTVAPQPSPKKNQNRRRGSLLHSTALRDDTKNGCVADQRRGVSYSPLLIACEGRERLYQQLASFNFIVKHSDGSLNCVEY